MIPTEVTRNRWLTRVWGVLLVGQTILLSFALIAIVRGTPDAYLNQHARLAASAAAGICLASLFLLRRPALQVVAMIGTIATIVWQITLTA
jgi:hypothetical protein